MSVAKMKFLNIIGPKAEIDRCASKFVISRGIHLENAPCLLESIDGMTAFSIDNPYGTLLKKAEEVFYHSNMPVCYDESKVMNDDIKLLEKYIEATNTHLIELYNKKTDIQNEINAIEQLILQLEIVIEMDIEIDKFFHLEFIKFRFGKMPRDSYKKLEFGLNDIECFFIPITIGTDIVWGMYFTSLEFEDKIDNIFKSLYFERVRISDKAKGTPKEALINLSNELLRLEKGKNSIIEETKSFINIEKENLISVYSTTKFLYETYNIRKNAAQTNHAFYLGGWVLENDASEIEKNINKDSCVSCIVEEAEEISATVPPTVLKNLPFVKPFEEFIKMYGLPSYNEIDPTFLVAITYILMFGIMFGDLGQGFVLAVSGFLLYKLKKIMLGGIIALAGVSSMIFGTLFGSVFGFEHLIPTLLIKPMENPDNINKMLISAVSIGVVFILMAMITNIINGIRQKNIEKMLFEQNGLAGFLFYLSIIIAVIYFAVTGKNILSFWFLAIFIILPVICIFLKEPLTHIVQRKKEIIKGGIGEFLTESFFELFEIILSFVTNTISFVRVGAFALSHAAMLMVVFMFAEMTKGAVGIVIIILGNILVIALEGLIVGIQVLRLEFYEIFGRFFSGDGKPFEPLIINNNKK